MRVVVLGGGIAGESFVAALHRLSDDVEITLVERSLVGGECSYFACIPSKTLLRPTELLARAKLTPGIRESVGPIDPEGVFAWRDEISAQDDTSQVEWIEGLGAKFVRGDAEIAEPGLVRVGDRELPYDHLVVATGSSPAAPPLEGLEDVPHWSSRDATSSSEVPESLLVVGGGAVGCELAQFYARMGSKVTIVNSGSTLLDRIDTEAGALLGEQFEADGMDVRTSTRPTAVEASGGRVKLLCTGDGAGEIEGAQLLLAVGRRPNTDGFGLDKLPVTIDRGLQVDDRVCAGENVWGIGDVTGKSLFTHVGKYQARIAAANIAGGNERADYRAVP